MPTLTRRRCLQTLAGAIAAPIMTETAHAAMKPSSREEKAIASLAEAFLKQYGCPGLSVAFSKQGQLSYAGSFGLADQEKGEKLTPEHRFRIASISKPFTSVAIFKLIEQGKLKLSDKVFGGLLGMDLSKAASPTVADITLHHLLTHTCGGWDNKAKDPMFSNPSMNHAESIASTLATHPLENQPGKNYAYSNFGFCVLGRVIEKVSGKAYAAFVQENVLTPCGIKDMQIAGDTQADRAANEVVYLGQDGESPWGMKVARMDSHGGWLATPTALVQFLVHVDGFSSPADILRVPTIKAMTTPTTANPGYACGFGVNAAAATWFHAGSLPGTVTIAARTGSGVCWAGFANSRCKGSGEALDLLMWQMAKAVPAWKA